MPMYVSFVLPDDYDVNTVLAVLREANVNELQMRRIAGTVPGKGGHTAHFIDTKTTQIFKFLQANPGPHNVKEIAALLSHNTSRQTVTSLLAQLAEQGFIERVARGWWRVK